MKLPTPSQVQAVCSICGGIVEQEVCPFRDRSYGPCLMDAQRGIEDAFPIHDPDEQEALIRGFADSFYEAWGKSPNDRIADGLRAIGVLPEES